MQSRFNRLSLLLFVLCIAGSLWVTTVEARHQQVAKPGSAALINLNTATAEQLDRLPGVGPKTAALIIDYRQKTGGFKRVEDVMNVRGIGEKSFLKLRPFITVTPAKVERTGSDK